jgi:hypothetical protein
MQFPGGLIIPDSSRISTLEKRISELESIIKNITGCTSDEKRDCEMKSVYGLSKEFQSGLANLYKESGYDALCQEMTNRVANMKSELLIAWFAEHGFLPGKAILVEERTENGWKIYIREKTIEDVTHIPKSHNDMNKPCKCEVKHTEVIGKCIIYPRKDCPYHGYLHSERYNEKT